MVKHNITKLGEKCKEIRQVIASESNYRCGWNERHNFHYNFENCYGIIRIYVFVNRLNKCGSAV